VITDPPYGTGYYKTDIDITEAFDRLLVAGRTVAVFGYPEILVNYCIWANAQPDEWVAWYPQNKTIGRCSGLPKSSEHIAIFGKTPGAKLLVKPRSNDTTGASISKSRGLSTEFRREDDVWMDAAPGMMFNSHLRRHPNEKPVSVMEKLNTLCTNHAETVIDPFMGSGTTGVACANLGRKFIGIEIEEKYFDIACERIAAAYAQGRLFE